MQYKPNQLVKNIIVRVYKREREKEKEREMQYIV